MTLLELVQAFCRRTNIDVPTAVMSSTNEQINQIHALLQEEGDDLVTRGDWQQLVNEATHTTVATESQGAITTIASNGFDRFKPNTFWDRSLNLPVYIVDGTDWQQIKGTSVTGPRYQARIRGNNLIVNPTPTAGNTWAFEYVSKNWILDDDGSTQKAIFAEDTDTPLFPDHVIMLGLRWRWKKEKGLEYAEDFRAYEAALKQALGGNGIRRTLNMSSYAPSINPRIVIPEGNWNL